MRQIDRIKSMSAEEMAEVLTRITRIQEVPKLVKILCYTTRLSYNEAFVEWLNSDVAYGVERKEYR